jgi:hypothetical protein
MPAPTTSRIENVCNRAACEEFYYIHGNMLQDGKTFNIA